jgi:hypothetical protein
MSIPAGRAAVRLDVHCTALERAGTEPSVVASLDRGRRKLDVEQMRRDELSDIALPSGPPVIPAIRCSISSRSRSRLAKSASLSSLGRRYRSTPSPGA